MTFGRTFLCAGIFPALATAAAAADMTPVPKAPPLEPPQQVSGYVETYGGWAETKESFFSSSGNPGSNQFDGWVLGGAGRGTYWWAPNASLQLDAQAEGTSYSNSLGSSTLRASSHAYLVGGHINWRNPQSALIGLFGGAGDATESQGSGDIRHGLIGAEGQAYWGGVTLYGQVGYNATLGDLNFGVEGIHAWFVRGTARVYVTPNFRLEGTVLFADGEYDFNDSRTQDFETWLWRAKGEYKFAASPFSIFAAYEGSRMKSRFTGQSGSFNLRETDHRILGGIRLYLGESTLQGNDNRGTTLDIIAPLSAPSFIVPRSALLP